MGTASALEQLSASGRYHAFIDHFAVTQPAYRASRLPSFLDRFDWVMSEPSRWFSTHRRCKDPRTVFAVPEALPELLLVASRDFDRSRRDRIIAFGASDTPLSRALGNSTSSRVATEAKLKTFFHFILYEALDVSVHGVRVMPIGLNEIYLSRGVAKNASAAIDRVRLETKTRIALAAWGAYWSLSNPSRVEAGRYVGSRYARQAGIDVKMFSPKDWWGALSQYRFLLIPMGSRIQCVKMIEALLVLTIPILQRSWYSWVADDDGEIVVSTQFGTFNRSVAISNSGVYPVFDDLIAWGFPIVVVNQWSEVTSRNLSTWWHELAPRLVSFRRNCLTAEAYWKMVTGATRRCE